VLKVLLRRAAAQSRLSINNRNLQRQLQYRGWLGKRVGRSPTMQEIFALSQLAGPTNACVLISGERGTGKELAGRTIHELNPHRHGPFFAINCAGLPETLIDMELLGHEKGAFTGTAERRAGCFEVARTEQLLRVLEDPKVRRPR